jgi:hypothetical protein
VDEAAAVVDGGAAREAAVVVDAVAVATRIDRNATHARGISQIHFR